MSKQLSGEPISIQPTLVKDLSERAIRRRMRSNALQHPAILLPLAVFIISIIYLLLLSPLLGGVIGAIVSVVVSGLVAAAGYVWRYTFCYTAEYARQVQELMDLMDQAERDEVEKLRESLHFGFFNIGAAEGLKALNELVSEYGLLQTALSRQSDADPFSMAHIPVLAREAFRRGLSVLSDALELIEAAGSVRKESLIREISELENKIEASKKDKNQMEWLQIKEEKLAFYRQHLTMLDHAQVRVDQLLFQAERCAASLHRTRIEVAAIRIGSSETNIDSVLQALQATINQMKEVQEELRRLGY